MHFKNRSTVYDALVYKWNKQEILRSQKRAHGGGDFPTEKTLTMLLSVKLCPLERQVEVPAPRHRGTLPNLGTG